ncbi:Exopolyphosphatase [Dispira parvispora]|uniref:Exopolyphosphatase n=1 Tax=Dispira parvispora TaxID=1520584 RepID=A0A9W8AQE8_9FUNG|nr:Exopolyphosphatase [Dispira parvispora]
MTQTNSLAAFVAELRSNLGRAISSIASGGYTNLVLVMGNESADLDSMISAITYAYWRYLSNLNSNAQQGSTVVVPLIDIPQEDFRIRPEAERVLQQTGGLDPNHLVFNDNPHIQQLFHILKTSENCDSVHITLVDHPSPNSDNKFLSKCVRGILDHHEDDHKINGTKVEPRWISMVGSATSLTTLEGYRLLGGTGLPSGDNHPRANDTSPITLPSSFTGAFVDTVRNQPNLFNLLLAPILADTSNMKKGGKVRPVDEAAASLIYYAHPPLASMLPKTPVPNLGVARDMEAAGVPFPILLVNITHGDSSMDNHPDSQAAYFKAWYEDITRARVNVMHLTGDELLRKDYKRWIMGEYQVGISSVIVPFAKWFQRDGVPTWERDFKRYHQAKKLDLLLIMTQDPKSSGRELLVYAPEFITNGGAAVSRTSSTRVADFRRMLENLQASDQLKLQRYGKASPPVCLLGRDDPRNLDLDTLGTKGYIMYDQLNTKSSRKQVKPLVQAALKKDTPVRTQSSPTKPDVAVVSQQNG